MIKNMRINQKNDDGYDVLHPETTAEQVKLKDHALSDMGQFIELGVHQGEVHGMRVTNGTLEYFDGEDWKATGTGGGSQPQEKVIYGVEIDTLNSDPETAVAYIEQAVGFTPARGNDGNFTYGSWKSKFPFNQIKPCLLKADGTVNYYLNPNDYTQKEDGTPSDITTGEDNGNVMIEFPKLWWKIETVGTSLFVRYANYEVDATYKCLAHTKAGVEKDKVYISAYKGGFDGTNVRSLSGMPHDNRKSTITVYRTQTATNGPTYSQLAYYQVLMLQVLYIVMFKDRDSQSALGMGNVSIESSVYLPTGGTDKKGLFFGENTGTQQMKFCGIEDLWGNYRYWVEGVRTGSLREILIADSNFNNTGSGYTNYGPTTNTSITSGYLSKVHGTTETGFLVTAGGVDGSGTTHYADNVYLRSSRQASFGGTIGIAPAEAGIFSMEFLDTATDSTTQIVARLMSL